MNFPLFTSRMVTAMMIVKIFIVITFVAYVIFALILYQQVITKHRTVATPHGPLLITIALIHLSFSLVLLFISFIL